MRLFVRHGTVYIIHVMWLMEHGTILGNLFLSIANFLQSRSWRGLEQNLGETPVSKVTVGLSGLPVHYDKETVADRSNDIH